MCLRSFLILCFFLFAAEISGKVQVWATWQWVSLWDFFYKRRGINSGRCSGLINSGQGSKSSCPRSSLVWRQYRVLVRGNTGHHSSSIEVKLGREGELRWASILPRGSRNSQSWFLLLKPGKVLWDPGTNAGFLTFRCFIFLGASGTVRIDESGDRDPDYSLKYYVNGSFQNIADYNHSTGGFNLRGHFLDEMPNCHCCPVLSSAHSFVAERVKTVFYLWKRIIKCFPSTLHSIKMKTQKSPISLDLILRDTQAVK